MEDKEEEPLIISNQKAKKIGFPLGANLTGEIDDLLMNCVRWFGTKA